MEEGKRGRGRPPKGGGVAASRDDVLSAVPKKRGRPTKASKGRGRPPKKAVDAASASSEDDSVEANGSVLKVPKPGKLNASIAVDSSGDDSEGAKPQKSPPSSKRRKLGRPRKVQPSDAEKDSDFDDDDERRPVGRPATGAVNLNIERTGRGQGRPKKAVAEKRAAAAETNGDASDAVPKKRGRPALGKPRAQPTGRPRGRPKAVKPDYNEDQDENEDDDGASDGEGAASSPKKRGRPPSANKSVSVAKPRGRPKQAGKTDEEPSVDSDDELPPSTPKKRGRPSGASSKSRGRPRLNKTTTIGEDDDDDDNNEDVVSVNSDNELSGGSPTKQRGRPFKSVKQQNDDQDYVSAEEIDEKDETADEQYKANDPDKSPESRKYNASPEPEESMENVSLSFSDERAIS